MNATLHERLIRAEQQFLLAVVAGDEESLEAFSQEWSQLRDDIKSIKAARQLDDHTALLFSKVSRAIESTTLCVLESGVILQESLTRSMTDFIQDIPFDDPSTASLHSQAIAPCHLLFSDLPSSIIPKILGQQKLLDSYAYSWLMQNIHDPYPNSAQTRILSDLSDASAAQVEIWFQEVRDSIGWSKLSHDFYADSVSATVAAARRVFLERDKNISFDIVFAFTAVKASAEMLFLEYPPLQGKSVDTGSITAIRTMDLGQDHHNDSINNPNSILVNPQVDLRALDPLSDLSDSDESEEEDTNSPPPIAGCKRLLAEDEPTSQVAGPGSPPKRRRTRSIYRTHSSEPECPHPLPSTLGRSSEQTISRISATPVSSFPSSQPLSPAPSPDPSSSISQKRGCVEATLKHSEGPIHAHVPVHGTRKRRLSQCVSPSPSKRQRRPSISSEGHSGTNPTPPFDGNREMSLPQGRPPDPDGFPQHTLELPLDSNVPLDLGVFDWNWIPDPLVGSAPSTSQPPAVYVPSSDLSSQPEPPIPVDLGVFDWNSIPDPLVGSAPSLSQPPVIYVPSSDLSSQLLESPNPGHDATFTSSSNDLGSLQDLRSLLQLPMPAGPDLTTSSAALPHEDDFSFSLEDLDLENIDLSTITDFDNLFLPDPTQWSSPSTSSSSPLTPPDNSFESLPLSQSGNASVQPSSQLDLSVPPSVLLPFGSSAFTEDVNNMCSLFPGEYSDPVAHTSSRAAC